MNIKPTHFVENWIMSHEHLAKVQKPPRQKINQAIAKWKRLSSHVNEPLDPDKFLEACEEKLVKTYGVARFEITKSRLQRFVRSGVDVPKSRFHAHLPVFERNGHTGYLNAVKHFFYAELNRTLDEELNRMKAPNTTYLKSPHELLINETMRRLKTKQ